MRNRQTTRHSPNRRLLQRGTTSFVVMTLLVGLTLDRAAEAADPIQVVAVAGQTVCTNFSTPDLEGPDTKVSGNGFFSVSVAGATVEVEVHTSQTKADFVVLDGPGVDAVVIKGASSAQLYTFADARDAQDMTSAAVQKIQTVTVCSDGEDTDIPNLPLPACNVGDNREEVSDCTDEDDAINAIIFKYATGDPEGAEPGQSFFCQCGDADAQTEGPLELGNNAILDELDSIGIVSINPTCFSWSVVGGKKTCVIP
jgi:hypothetical protein